MNQSLPFLPIERQLTPGCLVGVDGFDDIFEVNSITAGDEAQVFSGGHPLDVGLSSLKPIPLTTERLLALGLHLFRQNDEYESFSFPNQKLRFMVGHIRSRPAPYTLCLIDRDDAFNIGSDLCTLESVHHLQTTFYNLTGYWLTTVNELN